VRPDATVRKVVFYSQLWGYNALTVVNMFGWRVRDPARLVQRLRARDVDVVGPENDNWVREALSGAQAVVFGWGSLALREVVRQRAEVLLALVRAAQLDPTCLAVNADGTPTHPLYLANDLRPVPFVPRAATA